MNFTSSPGWTNIKFGGNGDKDSHVEKKKLFTALESPFQERRSKGEEMWNRQVRKKHPERPTLHDQTNNCQKKTKTKMQ